MRPSAAPRTLAPRTWTLAVLGVALLAALLHLPSLDHPFLYDDLQVVGNPDIRDPARAWRLLGRGYWEGLSGSTQGDQYRPLTLLSLNLSFQATGESPRGFRLVSLLLHGAASALVAVLGARLVGSPGAGVTAGLLHAVLPVNADTVVAVSNRGELQASVLALGAILLHLGSGARDRPPWGGALLYALAVLSKESPAALPLALLLLDRASGFGPPARAPRAWVRRYGPYGLALAGCLAARVAVLGLVGLASWSRYFETETSLVVALTMARFAALHYLRPTVLGAPLIADFTRHAFPDASPADPTAWLCLAGWVLAALACSHLAWRRRSPGAAAVAAGLLLLLPVSNLPVRTGILGAHRVLYLPAALAWSVGVAAAIRSLPLRPRGAWLRVALPCLVLAGHGWLARGRDAAWRDAESLWRDTVSKVPRNLLALDSLQATLIQEGRPEEAERWGRRALAIDPTYGLVGLNLAVALERQGRIDDALEVLAGPFPGLPGPRAARHDLRARLLALQGRFAEALEEATAATDREPGRLAFQVTRGAVLAALGRWDEARSLLERVASSPPRSEPDARARAEALRILSLLESR